MSTRADSHSWRLGAVGFSLLGLGGCAVGFLSQSVASLAADERVDDEPQLGIQLGFTLANLAVDVVAVGEYLLRFRGGWLGLFRGAATSATRDSAADEAFTSSGAGGAGSAGAIPHSDGGDRANEELKSLNIQSALAHVGLDTLRTVVSLITILVDKTTSIQRGRADDVGSIVTMTIALGVAAVIGHRLCAIRHGAGGDD